MAELWGSLHSQVTASVEDITLDTIKRMIQWDKKNKRLKDHHFKYMMDIADGKLPLTNKAKQYAKMNLVLLSKYGFK